MSSLPVALRLLAAAGLLAGATVHAAIFTVGSPSGPGQPCTHGTIQSALNAAESNPGADTVRLTRSLTYQPEANSISTSQQLVVEGGYATCTQAVADATNTVVSGTGGATEPVFRITVNSGGLVHLRRLQISGGDEEGSGKGGGIYFRGNGILEIRDSLVTQNTAGHGGGIYAEGTGSDSELVIGANVIVSNNTARYNGGGIVADQVEMSMLEPGSTLLGNDALGTGGSGGYGGGLYLRAGNRPGYATITSGGAGGIGAVVNNTARYGGGVAIGGSGDNGDSVSAVELRMYTTETGRPARLRGNFSSSAGGALHMQSDGGSFVAQIVARAWLWNAVVDDNGAPDGAAAYVAGNNPPLNFPGWERAQLYINGAAWPQGALPCPVGSPCARIEGNFARDVGGNATTGAILRGTVAPLIVVGSAGAGVDIRGNSGGRLVDATGERPEAVLRNALVAGNQFSQPLVRVNGASGYPGNLQVRDSTIAGNAVGGPALLTTETSFVTIERSVLWQPASPLTLIRDQLALSVAYTIASEVASLGGGSAAIVAEPRFTDPARGDFSLRAASPAIDRAPAGSGLLDALGHLRGVDLPLPVNADGPQDLGALERQSLMPMVLNADFDFSDLRLWTRFAGEWDGTQNASGGTNSGSWKYSASGLSTTRVVLGQQCIHLPGPGRYRLDGHGRTGGGTIATRDAAVLAWEFRRNGTEACNFGSPTFSGELTVGSGTSWSQAANPAVIDVAPADWTPTSSITVNLVGVDIGVVAPPNIGINVWFDGISLDLEGSDVIFRNGFD